MKFIYAFLLLFTSAASAQQLEESNIYECNFIGNLITTQSVRMKDYFDTQLGQRAGKIDLLDNLALIESTPVLVYQIPFIDQQFYVQLWNSKDVRVDAQLSLSGSNRTFAAHYTKGSLQQNLFCTTLNN